MKAQNEGSGGGVKRFGGSAEKDVYDLVPSAHNLKKSGKKRRAR